MVNLHVESIERVYFLPAFKVSLKNGFLTFYKRSLQGTAEVVAPVPIDQLILSAVFKGDTVEFVAIPDHKNDSVIDFNVITVLNKVALNESTVLKLRNVMRTRGCP